MSDRVIYYKAIAVLPKHMHVEVSCSTHRCTSRQQQSQSEDPIPTLPQTCCVQFILVLHDAQHCPGFAGMEQGAALSWPQQSTKHGATDQPWCMFRARPTPNTNKHPAAPRLQAQQHNNRRHRPPDVNPLRTGSSEGFWPGNPWMQKTITLAAVGQLGWDFDQRSN